MFLLRPRVHNSKVISKSHPVPGRRGFGTPFDRFHGEPGMEDLFHHSSSMEYIK